MTESRSVSFFNYPAVYTSQEDEFVEIFKNIGRRGAFILQQELHDFEKNISGFIGAKHVFGVADGTNAMIVGLRALGIGEGDEVIFSSHTYVATAAAIHFSGATPVPVECGPDHMMDPDDIERAITKKTRAIMPTQLNGRTCNMDAIRSVADRHGLLILEDAAQALGSKFKGKCAGTFGSFGTFSFYPAKVLGCFGDGGAIVTNDDDLAEKIALLRDHGRNSKGEHVAWGMNSRLDTLQAAILDCKLKRYPDDIRRRREIAALYESLLGDMPQLTLPPAPDSDPDHFDIYQNYEIEADNRDSLRPFLMENNIGCPIQWGGKPVHKLKNHGLDHHKLPFTEKMFERCFMLPMHPHLENEDVEYVAAKIREFYE